MLKQWTKKKRNVSGEQITKVLIIINEGAWTLNIEHLKHYEKLERNWNR